VRPCCARYCSSASAAEAPQTSSGAKEAEREHDRPQGQDKAKPEDKGEFPAPLQRKLALEATVGAFFPRLGSIGETGRLAALVGASYALRTTPQTLLSAGVRLVVTGDAWHNAENNTTTPPGGCKVPADESAAELAAFLTGAFGYKITPRLRAGGEAGLGFASYVMGSSAGGDVFQSTCNPKAGIKPALHFAAEASYAVTPYLRGVLKPFVIELHPSYDGARTAPVDAGGVWLRIGFALGAALDL
jgi:hypothetical protein